MAPEEGARTAQEGEEEEEGFGRKRCRKLGHLTPAPHSAPILLLFTPQIHTGCVSRNRHHHNFIQILMTKRSNIKVLTTAV